MGPSGVWQACQLLGARSAALAQVLSSEADAQVLSSRANAQLLSNEANVLPLHRCCPMRPRRPCRSSTCSSGSKWRLAHPTLSQ